MRQALVAIAALGAAACTDGGQVPVGDREAALRFLTRDQAPRPVKVVGLWNADRIAGGTVCGEIAAPEGLAHKRPRLRFVYDPRGGHGQVELHEGWVTASPVIRMLMEQNQMQFDQIWHTSCANAAPAMLRIEDWWQGV